MGDVPRSHDAAFGSLRDGTGRDLLLYVPASILVDDLGAMEDGFGSGFVGLEGLSAMTEE